MVSVIIPNALGGFQYLTGLMPLLSQEKDAEIIVFDNASHDGSVNYLSQFDVTIVNSRVNLGFARANNRAAAIAKGDYILLLNNDTVVEPGFLAKMVDTFNRRPNIGVVGCLMYTMNLPRTVLHAGVYFTPDYIPYEWGREVPGIAPAIAKGDPTIYEEREVPAVTGACLMVKRDVWDKLGGLDERFVNGWEDNDFCLRVREAGHTVWYTGKTFVCHKKFGSGGRFNFENQNRQLYDTLWVINGRAKTVLNGLGGHPQ